MNRRIEEGLTERIGYEDSKLVIGCRFDRDAFTWRLKADLIRVTMSTRIEIRAGRAGHEPALSPET